MITITGWWVMIMVGCVVFGVFLGITILSRYRRRNPYNEAWISEGYHDIKAVVKLTAKHIWIVLLGYNDSEPRYFKVDRTKILQASDQDITSANRLLKVNEDGLKYIEFVKQ